MKHLVLLTILLATPAAAQTSMLADPTLPDNTETRIVPEGTTPDQTAAVTPETIPDLMPETAAADDTLPNMASPRFPRPVYGPTCVEFVALNGHVICPRAITFYNDAPPSLVLGQR